MTNIILKSDNYLNDKNNLILFAFSGDWECVVCLILVFIVLAFSREALILTLTKSDIESPRGNKYKVL